MSDALEALGAIEQLIRWHLCEQEGMTSGQPTPEEWETAVDAAAEAVITIRAALEQGEAVVWQYTGEDGEECYTTIKAKALQFDANPTPLYTAPPSTAEAQARALEEMADEIYQRSLGDDISESSKDMLCYAAGMVRLKAKRIREEG